MSTILDALRKVEEEKRVQNPDVRTRLLANAPRFDFRTPRRSRVPWIVGGGLVLAGVMLGAGVMLWRSLTTTPVVEVAPSTTDTPQDARAQPQQPALAGQRRGRPTSPKTQPQTAQAPVPGETRSEGDIPTPLPRVAQITPEAETVLSVTKPTPAAPIAPARPPQIVTSGSGSAVVEPVPHSESRGEGNRPGAASGADLQSLRRSSEAMVQRSPFVNSSPYDRIVAPPPLPSPNAPRAALVQKQVRPRPPVVEKSVPPRAATPSSVNDTSEIEPPPRSAAPRPPTPAREEALSSPPDTSLSFLQWSTDPEKRVASIKVGAGPATIAHEGDSIEGLTVVKIRPDAVELWSGGTRYLLKAR